MEAPHFPTLSATPSITLAAVPVTALNPREARYAVLAVVMRALGISLGVSHRSVEEIFRSYVASILPSTESPTGRSLLGPTQMLIPIHTIGLLARNAKEFTPYSSDYKCVACH